MKYSKDYYDTDNHFEDYTNEGDVSIMRCLPGLSAQFILFDKIRMHVTKDSQVLVNIPIDEFGLILQNELTVPASIYYNEYEYLESSDFIAIDYGFLKNVNNTVKFVCLLPIYDETIECENRNLNFRFQGETAWKTINKIFMWSATEADGVPIIELQNLPGLDVKLKLLLGK